MASKHDILMKVRQFCSECMGGPRAGENIWPVNNPSDITNCTDKKCIWYQYRFGSDPEKNPEKVKRGQEMAAKLHKKRRYNL